MSYKLKSLKKVENNKVVMDLEITNNYLGKSINTAYQNISQKAKIPGFRKGRVPYNIIDINFGKEYVLNEAATLAISELYPKIIEDSDIKPIDYPKVKINEIGEDKPLGFEITVEVEPEIELPIYKGIEVTGISDEASEKEVDVQVEHLRSHYATLEPLEDTKAVSNGDFVIIDFEGKIDGKDFEGSSAQDYTLEVGSKTLFKEFEDSLVGLKKGETKEVNIALPDSIANKDLTGKNAEFKINVKEIKRKVLPEMDQEFLKNFGEYKSVEEFKEFIKDRIVEQKQKTRRDRMISDIVRNMVENSKFEAPEPMVKNRINHIMEDFEKELKENKISRADYLRTLNLTEEKMQENIKKSAATEVKEYLIFNALDKAEAKNIEPSAEEIKKETERIIDSCEKDEDKTKVREYLDTSGGIEELKVSIRRKNLFDFLIKNAKITEEKDLKAKSPGKKLWTPGDKANKVIKGSKYAKMQEGAEEKKLGVPNQLNKNKDTLKKESGDK